MNAAHDVRVNAAAIRAHTGLEVRAITELGRGTGSVAYLVDGAWVFRFPMTDNARRTLRRELALLGALGPALPLPIPAFEHVARAGEGPHFVGYRRLPGVPLTADAIDALPAARQDSAPAGLAAFLEALHRFPVEQARAAGVASERISGGYHPTQRALIDELAPRLDAHERARLHATFDRYETEFEPERVPPALLHSDLKPAHVLYDRDAGRIGGVLDWGDVSVGDPDFDLAVVGLFFGQAFLTRLLEHLPGRDPETVLAKARFFMLLRAVQDLAYSAGRGEGRIATRSLAHLRAQLER
jgi:aminoglycoside 2''-phosphotransferase